jgi:hypothetical protein
LDVITQAVIASEAKQSPSRKEEIASSQKTLLAMTRAGLLLDLLILTKYAIISTPGFAALTMAANT